MGAKRPPLKIQEVDGSPSGYPNAVKFPNGTLTDNGDGTYTFTPIGTGGAIAVEEVDGSPADAAATKIIFPNGTLAIVAHEATYTPSGVGGSGALVFLEAHTASASSSLDFTSFISSTYDDYLFELVDIVMSTTNTLLLRCSVAAAFDSGANYEGSSFVWSSAGSAVGGTGTTSILIYPYTGRTFNTTASKSVAGHLRLVAPAGANHKRIYGQFLGGDSVSSITQKLDIIGAYLSASAVDGVRFLPSSGTITSGVIRVYGYAKS